MTNHYQFTAVPTELVTDLVRVIQKLNACVAVEHLDATYEAMRAAGIYDTFTDAMSRTVGPKENSMTHTQGAVSVSDYIRGEVRA